MRFKLSVTLTGTLAIGLAISMATLLSLNTTTAYADSGLYSVPVATDLQPYAVFPIEIYVVKNADQITIQYQLPLELTGIDGQVLSFQGPAPQENGPATTLSGPQGSASCTDGGAALTCKMTLQNIQTDLTKVQTILSQNASASPAETAARFEVAKEFSAGPVGIVTYGY